MELGDFTGLGEKYSQNRPDYSKPVLKCILGLIDKPSKEIDFVDVGAGTGIWTRMVNGSGVHHCTAVEPNVDMRESGISDSSHLAINWVAGSAEATGLSACTFDWVSMASSFHWANFERSTTEFHRILRPGGYFTALWNPRLVEIDPLLLEIEEHIRKIAPNIKRVSSGRSGITGTLSEKLSASDLFEDVIYMDGRHVVSMTPERYLGIWRSVNDLRVQLGVKKFERFLSFVDDKISHLDVINATYLTRAWTARRAGA